MAQESDDKEILEMKQQRPDDEWGKWNEEEDKENRFTDNLSNLSICTI
jgi:hypothetical protein